jgi:hypothetical protein
MKNASKRAFATKVAPADRCRTHRCSAVHADAIGGQGPSQVNMHMPARNCVHNGGAAGSELAGAWIGI